MPLSYETLAYPAIYCPDLGLPVISGVVMYAGFVQDEPLPPPPPPAYPS